MVKIIVRNLGKKFRIGVRGRNIFSLFFSMFSGVELKKDFWALKNVSFDLNDNENLGIIGANGAGKSTLLYILAGIYQANSGMIKKNGRFFLLSSLSNGLKSRLSLKDNIFLVCSIMGLSKNQIKNKFSEIVEFAGLEDFIDTKIYQFSSGMKQRLAFSITMHCLECKNLDILFIDEIISGSGDLDFKKKANKKMEDLIKGDNSIILVSHNLGEIERLCDRVIWIDKGEIIMQGAPKKVIKSYIDNYNNRKEAYRYLKKEERKKRQIKRKTRNINREKRLIKRKEKQIKREELIKSLKNEIKIMKKLK